MDRYDRFSIGEGELEVKERDVSHILRVKDNM